MQLLQQRRWAGFVFGDVPGELNFRPGGELSQQLLMSDDMMMITMMTTVLTIIITTTIIIYLYTLVRKCVNESHAGCHGNHCYGVMCSLPGTRSW